MDVPTAPSALSPLVTTQAEAQDDKLRLTLEHLLHPEQWDLPESIGPYVLDPQSLADKLQVLDRSVALLKRYRNSLCPIHRLSPDVLALVFLDLVDDCESPSTAFNFGAVSWVYIAHVCHRWRTIALGCATLWTQISTRYPEAALACLDRAGDAPLSLLVHPGATSSNSKLVLDRVYPHMNRMRHLYVPWTHVYDQNGLVSELLSSLIDAPAPLLETFHVYRVRESGGCLRLPTVFGGHTPRLRVLKLSYLYPHLGNASFGCLKELYIRGRKREPVSMELSDLLDILQACPVLEVFVILKACFKSSFPLEEVDEPTRRIRLDRLRRINISRCTAHIAEMLLSRLIVPNCQLSIDVWLDRRSDFRFEFGVPVDLCEEHPLRDVRKLQVAYCSGNSSVALIGMTHAHPFHIIATIEPETNIGDMPTISGQLLLCVAKTLDLSLLEEFTVAETSFYHPHVGFSRDVWAQVLARMPLLRTLHIRLQSLLDSGFCRAVVSALATPDERTGRALCPLLDTISLAEDKTWSSLQWYKFARVRREAGHPLRHLSVHLPHYENVEDMAETDLASLREVIDVVDLDPPEPLSVDLPDASGW
ncbi:hypothetical protein C8Q79DRAFT_620139 [Trametes meyenii]|nr:hypothetical protein C8Q79DRAFT_620139 [Trametes meyenii]